jgi:hypothetical protein
VVFEIRFLDAFGDDFVGRLVADALLGVEEAAGVIDTCQCPELRSRRPVRAATDGTAVRLSDLVRVLLGVQAGVELGCPDEGPGAQVG